MDPPDKNIYKLAEGAGLGLAGKVVGRFLNLVGDVVAARMLGPAVFGLYSIGWTLFRLTEIMAPLGLDRAVLRFIPRFAGSDTASLKEVVFKSIRFSVLVGVILGIAVYSASGWLANSVFEKPELTFILRFFAFGFPVSALLPVVGAIIRSGHTVKYSVLVQDIGQPLLALGFIGGFYLLGGRLVGVLAADVISYTLAAGWGLLFVRRLYPALFDHGPISRRMTGALLKYSVPVAVGGMFSALIYWIDRLFVGYYRTGVETGVYQAASQVSLIFAVVLSGMSTILAPQFSRLHHAGDTVGLSQAYRIGNKWSLYIGLPLIAVVMIAPQRVLTVLYGSEYSGGWIAMLILLLGQAINLAAGASAPLLVMAGGQNIWFVLTMIAFVFDAALGYWLTPMLGINGAALATSSSVGFLFISVLVMVRWKFHFWPYDRRVLKGLWAAGFALIVSWFVGWIALPDWGVLLIQLGVSVLTFGLVLFALRPDAEDSVLVDLIRRRLAARAAPKHEI
jgi:O-antigen/teichoic acid export membrane protein